MVTSNASARLKGLFREAFSDDEDTLQRYGSSFAGTPVKPLCIVYPSTAGQLAGLLDIAREEHVPIYPLSRGRNFGYGEAQGTASGQVIVDLSRMNRILEVNESMGYVRIEPGVSQDQLYRHLQEKRIALRLDVTGAGSDASIMGNVLERGFGHTDYGDRFARIVGLAAITGTGTVLRTGFGGFAGDADAANVYRYGLGPVLDGLFSQSNFGIVTELTLELMPVPARTEMFVFSTKDKDAVGDLVTVVRTLRLNDLVGSTIHIANKARAVGEKSNRFVGAWNLSGSVSGPRGLVAARRRAIRKVFRKHLRRYKLWFIGPRLIALARFIHEKVRPFPVYPALRDAYDLLLGVPTDHPLKTLMNDESLESSGFSSSRYDTCFQWINAVCMCEGGSVRRLLAIMEEAFQRGGYEFRVTFTAVNPRTLIMISNINYPKEPAAIEKGTAFVAELQATLAANGFFPYRSGSGHYGHLPVRDPGYLQVITGLKKMFDPDNVIAPGKYNV